MCRSQSGEDALTCEMVDSEFKISNWMEGMVERNKMESS